jgi:hypothetical protein
MLGKISTPGFTTDLSERGREGWIRYITSILEGTAQKAGVIQQATNVNGIPPALLLDGDPALESGTLQVDWKGYPERVKQAINKLDAKVDQFLDWTRDGATIARATCHEEYLEWRTVRRADGKIIRIEYTTETPDYWANLARFEPRKLVELAARFAGEAPNKVDIPMLFGTNIDPFIVDPFTKEGEDLEAAYREQNWSVRGKIKGDYNNGKKAMMHMAIHANSTNAAVALAVYAAYPHAKTVGSQTIALSGPEAIAATDQAAVNCRNSDPTIVGSAIQQAFRGAKIALMEAIGLYILTTPLEIGLHFSNGSKVPESWFSRQRGSDRFSNPVGIDLFQRLVIEPPPGSDLTISHLLDVDGKEVKSGAQIARQINVALHLRKTRDVIGVNPIISNQIVVSPCNGTGEEADNFRALFTKFSAPAMPTPQFTMLRGGNVIG